MCVRVVVEVVVLACLLLVGETTGPDSQPFTGLWDFLFFFFVFSWPFFPGRAGLANRNTHIGPVTGD